MIVGITFAIVAALLSSVDTLINKDIMKDNSAKAHAILRIVFVIPFLAIASIFNWVLKKEAILYLLLYGLLEAINIFFHQSAIKKGNPVHIELISKSKILLVLIVSFIIGIDELSIYSAIAIVVFVIGTILAIDTTINKDIQNKTSVLSLIFEIISVLARTFKPFIIKFCLNNETISSETLTFLSMPIALIVLLILFRPKVRILKTESNKPTLTIDSCTINLKKYIVQALIVSIGMLCGAWSIQYGNAVISNSIGSLSVFFIMLFSIIVYKKKYKILSYVGIAIAVIGVTIACVL